MAADPSSARPTHPSRTSPASRPTEVCPSGWPDARPTATSESPIVRASVHLESSESPAPKQKHAKRSPRKRLRAMRKANNESSPTATDAVAPGAAWEAREHARMTSAAPAPAPNLGRKRFVTPKRTMASAACVGRRSLETPATAKMPAKKDAPAPCTADSWTADQRSRARRAADSKPPIWLLGWPFTDHESYEIAVSLSPAERGDQRQWPSSLGSVRCRALRWGRRWVRFCP